MCKAKNYGMSTVNSLFGEVAKNALFIRSVLEIRLKYSFSKNANGVPSKICLGSLFWNLESNGENDSF